MNIWKKDLKKEKERKNEKIPLNDTSIGEEVIVAMLDKLNDYNPKNCYVTAGELKSEELFFLWLKKQLNVSEETVCNLINTVWLDHNILLYVYLSHQKWRFDSHWHIIALCFSQSKKVSQTDSVLYDTFMCGTVFLFLLKKLKNNHKKTKTNERGLRVRSIFSFWLQVMMSVYGPHQNDASFIHFILK